MGWTSIYQSYLRNKKTEGIREYLINEYEMGGNLSVIDFSKKGSTVYMAIKVVATGEVFAEVVLTAFEQGEFYYKSISESMGPCQVECPQRILKKLSDTDIDYALDWRKHCWEFHEKNRNSKGYKHGDIVRFPEEITFTNGVKSTEFVLCKEGRAYCFAPYSGQTDVNRIYGPYQIRKWKQSEPEVIGSIA